MRQLVVVGVSIKSQASFFKFIKTKWKNKNTVPCFHKVIWCEEIRLRKVCFRDQRTETRRRMERGFQQLLSTGQSLIILKGLLALAAWKADLGAKTKGHESNVRSYGITNAPHT